MLSWIKEKRKRGEKNQSAFEKREKEKINETEKMRKKAGN